MFSKLMGSLKLMYSKKATILDEISKFYLKLLSNVKKVLRYHLIYVALNLGKFIKSVQKLKYNFRKKLVALCKKAIHAYAPLTY